MPELPEVETTKRALQRYVQGKTLTNITIRHWQLRYPIPKTLASMPLGVLNSVDRHGKYLLLRFDAVVLLVHLGMSGSMRVVDAAADWKKHDHVAFVFANCAVRYHDPRRFGCMVLCPDGRHPLLDKVGVDPITQPCDGAMFQTMCQKSTRTIKALLMDNALVCGIGNIYANEILFASKVHPEQRGCALRLQQCEALMVNATAILQQAITQGGTTLRDFVSGTTKAGYFAQQLQVYGKAGEPCVHCGTAIALLRQHGRSSFYCPHCQILPDG